MSWNISVTTVIGGGGNRPGIYAGKFSPNEFHDLPFLVKLPVGSLFLKTGEQNPDCTVGCASGMYQKVCSDCGGSSWVVFDSSPPIVLTFTVVNGVNVNINLVQSGDIPHWVSGDGAEYDSVNFSHTYAEGLFNGSAAMLNRATEVDCKEASLTKLDVSGLTTLEQLYCDDNQLTALDVSANPLLEIMYCDKNQLTVLDVSANPLLEYLRCWNNQLTVLDISGSPLLEQLYCYDNQLTVLDVSANPLLKLLFCYDNQLTVLDVSANPLLEFLIFNDNQLTVLDVSANPLLGYLECNSNLMPEAAVDQVIADVEAHGTSDGLLDIGGTNAAPSAAGLADVALLQGRGWTVTTS